MAQEKEKKLMPKGFHSVGSFVDNPAKGLGKKASPGGMGGGQGSANVTMAQSQFYSPELTPESWLLPKSRQEVIKWCRIFYNLEPYVQRILNLHSNYPFSKFKLVCDDEKVLAFYEKALFNEKWDLYDTILRASLSYQVYGEAVMFGNWNAQKKMWDRFVLLEPEVVEIHQDLYDESPTFEMIPTEDLRKIVNNPSSENLARREKLPEVVVEAIKSAKNIPLDPKSVSIIARTTSPSAIRGTPVLQSCFKILIYQDNIRLAQLKIAERHQLPFELWTLGSLEHKILPTEEDLERVRDMINQAIANPPFVLVYPPILNYTALGVKDKLLNIYEDLGYVENQLLVGLGVNKNLILGEGPSFTNTKAMSLNCLIMEYQALRDKFEKWIYQHVFHRISEENKFYKFEGDDKKLIIPKIEWEKSLDIEGEESERKLYIDLHSGGYLSTKTLYTKFPNLNFEAEKKLIQEEADTVFDKKDGKRLPKKPGEAGAAPAGGPGGAKPSAGGAGGGLVPGTPPGGASAVPAPPKPATPPPPPAAGGAATPPTAPAPAPAA